MSVSPRVAYFAAQPEAKIARFVSDPKHRMTHFRKNAPTACILDLPAAEIDKVRPRLKEAERDYAERQSSGESQS